MIDPGLQGVEAVSQEIDGPMGSELRRVVTEARLGRPLEESLDDKDAAVNQEKRLTVRLGLRTFGETFPERVMGFAAEGSATIKVDVGKKLRAADRTFAIKSACEGAVGDALAASLTKLALPPPPSAPKPKKR